MAPQTSTGVGIPSAQSAPATPGMFQNPQNAQYRQQGMIPGPSRSVPRMEFEAAEYEEADTEMAENR